jgi:uncharacterized circularly permuted ATP-grasp superfamily protein
MALVENAAPPAPATNRLQDYPVDVDAGDLFRHASGDVAEKWVAMANGLSSLAAESGLSVQELVARQIQDMGMSFRIAGDDEEREWPLTPMPLLIGAQEWADVERGLIQRARLLEQLVADIYGPQRLVDDGFLPAAVIAGSRYFARNMVGLKPRADHYLHVYAVDLARGPRGQWRVLGDRLRLANGIGYALENRLALSRGTGTLLSDINARRVARFFGDLRAGIARDCQRESPRIALLTPGRFNQSYPEQAHLARYLGFPLVEGRDLTVIDDRLYIRTIAGPKRIDAVWRWIDTNALDPLSFDARSTIGVPDMFDAWASGGLEMTNWPGVELLEAPAFAAFMPRLCRTLLGEEPLLPNIATWWCGQPVEADIVRARFDEFVITPAFGQPVEGLEDVRGVAGASLPLPRATCCSMRCSGVRWTTAGRKSSIFPPRLRWWGIGSSRARSRCARSWRAGRMANGPSCPADSRGWPHRAGCSPRSWAKAISRPTSAWSMRRRCRTMARPPWVMPRRSGVAAASSPARRPTTCSGSAAIASARK